MITLIRGGWVVGFDGARHRIVSGGEVAFEGDRVIYAGPKFPGTADRVLAKDTWLVSPGFINLHGHIGVEPMLPLVDLPRDERFAPSKAFASTAPLVFEPTLTPEEQQLSGEYKLVQMLKSGTTTVLDAAGSGTLWWLGNQPHDEEMLVDTAGRLGARVYLSLSYRSARACMNPDGSRDWVWDDELGMAGLREAVRFCREYGGAHDGLVQAMLCPHAAENCSPELLRATKAAAAENGLLIQLHTAQRLYEVELIRERYSCTPVEHLRRIGFLGPEVSLGHGLYTSGHPAVGGDPDQDLESLADSGTSVAHSPEPYARGGEAMYSLPRYLRAGVNVAMGCDMWPADIIGEMRLAWLIGKITAGDAVHPTAREVYDCATLGGARALHRDDLGRLAPGAKADIVCIDLGRYHIGPVLDPIRSLLTCASGQDVETVVVDGREVVSEGRVLAADEARLRSTAHTILENLQAAAAERDPRGYTARALLSDD